MAEYEEGNVFAKIIDGQIPSYRIFETDKCLAILDAFPVTDGHSLLIPKEKKYATVMDMPPDVAGELFAELPRLMRVVKEATGCKGVNVVHNCGKVAGQVVFHAHIHVIPATEDKRVSIGGSGGMITAEKATPLLEAMKAKL